MSPKQKMIEIVGSSIDKVLKEKSNKQVNLASESARIDIATEILDIILKKIENPTFKKEKTINGFNDVLCEISNN